MTVFINTLHIIILFKLLYIFVNLTCNIYTGRSYALGIDRRSENSPLTAQRSPANLESEFTLF